MTDWQTIDTAPKDGTHILGFGRPHKSHGSAIALVRWEQTEYSQMQVVRQRFNDAGQVIEEERALVPHERGYWDGEISPTHWIPMPEPPDERGYIKEE